MAGKKKVTSSEMAETLMVGDEDVDFEFPPPPPVDPRMMPPKKEIKATAKDRKEKRLLEMKAPSAVSMEFYKLQDGKEHYINQYGYREIERYPTIEAFILKNLVPNYDYGDYALYIVQQNGDKQSRGVVAIAKPERAGGVEDTHGNPMTEVLQMFQGFQREAQEEARRREEEAERKTELLMQNMKQNMDSTINMLKMSGEGGGGNNMMLMFMIQGMMQQQQQQMQQIAESFKGGKHEDSAIDKLLPVLIAKMTEQPKRDDFDFPREPYHMPEIRIPDPPPPPITMQDVTSFLNLVKDEKKESKSIMEQLMPFLPMAQSLFDKVMTSNKERETEYKRMIERMEDKIERLQNRGDSGGELPKLLEGLGALRQASEHFFPHNVPHGESGVMDSILEVIPQVTDLIKSFVVDNPGGGNLPDPEQQAKVTVEEVLVSLPEMSEQEVIEALGFVLAFMMKKYKSVIAKQLTGDPEKDNKVLYAVIEKVIHEYVRRGKIKQSQSADLMKIVSDNIDNIRQASDEFR